MRLAALTALLALTTACAPADPAVPAVQADDLRSAHGRVELSPTLERLERVQLDTTLAVLRAGAGRCGVDGAPVIREASATQTDAAVLHITLAGQPCDGELLGDFGFEAFDADGQPVYSRSWTEPGPLTVADGAFHFEGEIWSCATWDRVTEVALTFNGRQVRVSVDPAE